MASSRSAWRMRILRSFALEMGSLNCLNTRLLLGFAILSVPSFRCQTRNKRTPLFFSCSSFFLSRNLMFKEQLCCNSS
uniref:Uncharacterized protein n=1 Tax=Rhizophora mucronata TaxID=61149 RepID=A0A2P2P7R3_RHIMU